jgi:hypothetical protein
LLSVAWLLKDRASVAGTGPAFAMYKAAAAKGAVFLIYTFASVQVSAHQ